MYMHCAEYLSESPRNDLGGDQKHDFMGEWPHVQFQLSPLRYRILENFLTIMSTVHLHNSCIWHGKLSCEHKALPTSIPVSVPPPTSI